MWIFFSVILKTISKTEFKIQEKKIKHHKRKAPQTCQISKTSPECEDKSILLASVFRSLIISAEASGSADQKDKRSPVSLTGRTNEREALLVLLDAEQIPRLSWLLLNQPVSV